MAGGGRGGLIAVLAIALAVRLALAHAVQHQLDHVLHRQFLVPGDAEAYWALAGAIVEGEPYSIYGRQLLRMPGYPAILAVSRAWFGENMLAARYLLAVIGTLGCAATFGLGATLFNRRVGFWASLYVALSPLLAGFGILILSEAAFATFLTASLWFTAGVVKKIARRDRRDRLREAMLVAVVAGLFSAAATYIRPTWIIGGPLVGAALVLWRPLAWRQWVVAGLLVSSSYLPLVPWAWRNLRVTGHWISTTLWVGPSLYDGLRPDADGDSDMTFFERDGLPARLSEYEVDHEYRRRAWAWAAENPGRALQLAWLKQLRYWSLVPNAEQFSSWPLRLFIGLTTLPLFALAALGVVVYRRRLEVLLICVGPILLFAAVHAIFVGSVRYRLPAEPALAVLAAAALVWLMGRCRGEGTAASEGAPWAAP